MDTFLIILAIIFALISIVGSVLPALPGPVLGYAALWIAHWSGYCHFSTQFMLIMAALTVVVFVLDYVLPPLITRKMGGSKFASRGAVIGMVLGMFFSPVGMLLGMLLGAFIGELIYANNSGMKSLSAAFGAFFGFLVGTGIKLMFCAYILYKIVATALW